MNTEISYDQLISRFIDERMEGEDSIWRQASIAYFMKEQMKIPANKIASDVGYSSRYINEMVKTFTVFPTEETRARDMTYSIHAKCATTDNPEHWLDEACANGYSVKELAQAIKGEPVEKDELTKAKKLWDDITKILEARGPGAEYIREQIGKVNVPTYTETGTENEKVEAGI